MRELPAWPPEMPCGRPVPSSSDDGHRSLNYYATAEGEVESRPGAKGLIYRYQTRVPGNELRLVGQNTCTS